MLNLCLAIGASVIVVGDTLKVSWTHSVEKILWEEYYKPNVNLVELTQARVRGNGAGMDIPSNAKKVNGYWEYTPIFNKFAKVTLTHSPYTKPYTLCKNDKCHTLPELFPNIREEEVVELYVCNQ